MSQAMADTADRTISPPVDRPDIRHLTAGQFRLLGLTRIAYLTGLLTGDGSVNYVVRGADGEAVAVVEQLEDALELAIDRGVMLVAVH